MILSHTYSHMRIISMFKKTTSINVCNDKQF